MSKAMKCEDWISAVVGRSSRIRFIRTMAALAIILTEACAVGPDYKAPQTVLPSEWHNKALIDVSLPQSKEASSALWWISFDDSVLSSVMEKAVKANKEIMGAEARLKEARAKRDFAAGDRLPTVSASASASRRRGSAETGSGKTTDFYDAGFDARWELDIFGAKQRAKEAAEANLQAGEEDLRDVMVSLTAEVGINYLEARSLQTRLAIASEALSAQNQSYEIARWRREAGLVTQLDEDQAIAAYQQTKAQIPSFEASLEQNLNRLAVLLGETPGSLHALMGKSTGLPLPPGGVAVGIPADLLRRRPDIRRAERNLAAATAQVGVATAALYPSFPLTGSLGLEALSTGGLFTANAHTWALVLAPVLTLFDAGKNRSNVDAATARQEQALAAYESALLSALADVEDALSAYAREQRRLEALLAAEAATLSAFKLASDQYSAGLADFLVVLVAQRSLLTAQDQRAVSEVSVLTDLIRLYKALGGGWMRAEEKEKS